MISNTSLNSENVLLVEYEECQENVVYELAPKSQEGQILDLNLDVISLHPERLSINFTLLDPMIVHHVKAWISYACKKYSNQTLFNVFTIINRTLIIGECDSSEVEGKIIDLVKSYVESDSIGPSQKSFLRSFYGWCVLHELPFFDEDFYDYYLDVKKFGSDEGKGKDVIIDIPNRGPLTLRELKDFKKAITKLDLPTLSSLQLQGLIGLKIGQVIGARDIQVIKLQFKHLKQSMDGTYYLEVPRAKQRGRQNNAVLKKRPITKSLAMLIIQLKGKYAALTGNEIPEDWFIVCNHLPKPVIDGETPPTGIRVTSERYRARVKSILELLGLNFLVTNRRLRKTFCTQLIAKGTTLKVVAELMDHSDLQQLEVYYRHTHHVAKKLNDVLMREADDIIDAFAGKIVTKEEVSQKGQEIFAHSEGQGLHLIGSCGSGTPCALNPPLSCYGCSSLEAFEDADHKAVVETFVSESKRVFGEQHAIEILQHDDYLAASKFVQMLERGEL